jgi:ribonucleoside-diphosphate reductase alpha chain
MSVSIGLQHGVPLQTYVDQFTFTRFEPQGVVEGHPNVKLATSIVDYLFRVLGVEYLHRYDLAHVKPEGDNASVTDDTAGMTQPKPVSSMPPMAMPNHDQSPLSYTKEAVVRSAQMSEGLEQVRAPSHGAGALEDATSNGSPLDAHLDAMMGDAPVCDVCGHITVRNGACYKCLNCGNSMGCS